LLTPYETTSVPRAARMAPSARCALVSPCCSQESLMIPLLVLVPIVVLLVIVVYFLLRRVPHP
jgi:hypothetical protein